MRSFCYCYSYYDRKISIYVCKRASETLRHLSFFSLLYPVKIIEEKKRSMEVVSEYFYIKKTKVYSVCIRLK
jgi:hypothetical protein